MKYDGAGGIPAAATAAAATWEAAGTPVELICAMAAAKASCACVTPAGSWGREGESRGPDGGGARPGGGPSVTGLVMTSSAAPGTSSSSSPTKPFVYSGTTSSC